MYSTCIVANLCWNFEEIVQWLHREGIHAKEREGTGHQYQWPSVCVPGAGRGPHGTGRNGQWLSCL